jgi:hypothetical protein
VGGVAKERATSLNSLDTTIFWENFLQYVDEFCNLIGREANLYVKLSLI